MLTESAGGKNMGKTRKTLFIVITILSVIIGSTGISGAADYLLGVPETTQQHSQWCWAGSSKGVLDFYGNSVSQCAIANWAWGRTDCCGNAKFTWNSECNQPNSIADASGSLQDILQNWGVASAFVEDALSKADFVAQIEAERPFVMRFGWTGGGGHFLDGYGYAQDGAYMDYMDPWPGNGYTRSLYDWVVSSSDHTWTHTLRVTTDVTTPLAVTLSGNGTGAVSWKGITCSTGACVYTYAPGSSLTLTAKPATGSVFTGWTGCAASSKNTCKVTLNAATPVTATFIKPPAISVTPASLNYGTVKEGATYSKTVTVTNAGVTALTVSHAITGAGASQFTADGCADAVAQGDSCDLTVDLVGASYGTKNAKLTLTSNDPKKPTLSVSLSGNVKPPVISVSPLAVNFGAVAIGTTPAPTKTITVRNTGVTDLTITDITDPTNPAFTASFSGCSAPVQKDGAPCTITITFDPTDTTQQKDAITIASNAAKPVKVTLSGKGK
jgi:hypothetical protein